MCIGPPSVPAIPEPARPGPWTPPPIYVREIGRRKRACGDFIPEECQATILRLGPDGRNSDVLYRIPANMSLPAHWHTSPERMILISGEFHIDYEGHDPIVMPAGSYAWGPPGVPHTARCADRGTCLLFVAFVDPPDGFPVQGRDD